MIAGMDRNSCPFETGFDSKDDRGFWLEAQTGLNATIGPVSFPAPIERERKQTASMARREAG